MKDVIGREGLEWFAKVANDIVFPNGYVYGSFAKLLSAARLGLDLLAVLESIRSERGDDHCWMDIDRVFAAAGQEAPRREVGDKFAMLKNCARYIDVKCDGGDWKSYAELENENKRLHDEADRLTQEEATWRDRASVAEQRAEDLEKKLETEEFWTDTLVKAAKLLATAVIFAGRENWALMYPDQAAGEAVKALAGSTANQEAIDSLNAQLRQKNSTIEMQRQELVNLNKLLTDREANNRRLANTLDIAQCQARQKANEATIAKADKKTAEWALIAAGKRAQDNYDLMVQAVGQRDAAMKDLGQMTASRDHFSQQAVTAQERLNLVRKAITDTGYFQPEQIGDDLAPRVTELINHYRTKAEQEANREPRDL